MDGALHTDFTKSKITRDIKKSFKTFATIREMSSHMIWYGQILALVLVNHLEVI